MGLLEGYFVPTYLYSLTPKTFEDKVKNLELAFELMRTANINLPKTQPEGRYGNDLLNYTCIVFKRCCTFMHLSSSFCSFSSMPVKSTFIYDGHKFNTVVIYNYD